MIVLMPPQLHSQQVAMARLAVSIILLILTVSPQLFHIRTFKSQIHSVSCLTVDGVSIRHKNIENFSLIDTDDLVIKTITKQRSVRSLKQTRQDNNGLKEVYLSALDRKFKFILSKASNLITDDFTVVEIDAKGNSFIVPLSSVNSEILQGSVVGEPRSFVTAILTKVKDNMHHNGSDTLMTARINSRNATIIIEPAYLHKDSFNIKLGANLPLGRKMIVYKEDDLDNSIFDPQLYCQAVDLNRHDDNLASSDNHTLSSTALNIDIPFKRNKRGFEDLYSFQSSNNKKDKSKCTLHIVADHLFYHFIGNDDSSTTVNYILALINRVNRIYMPIEWDAGDEKFKSIGFLVQNISIHHEFTTPMLDEDVHYNMQIESEWTARDFLDNFSRHSPSKQYCLAHLLTYRHFTTPVLGLAYVASPRNGAIGGLCSPAQRSREDIIYRHNTGTSTSKGINGEALITRQADLVVAHELAHNLGAEHDSHECRPSFSQGGAYLMHPYSVLGFETNNRYLSECSKTAIAKVLKKKANTCFIEPMEDICGNGIVDKGEECDGGSLGSHGEDNCCDSNCKLKPGAQCSDRHSLCCTQCKVTLAGVLCRRAEEFNCKDASICDGRSSECPAPPSVRDNRTCLGRGICKSGKCIPFCEANDLMSCLCTSSADACKLCCKTTVNAACSPYDIRAPYLPDGVSCFKGVCEKGRCEQQVQDVVERLWDVLEDVNFRTVVKILRDNIVIVVLALTIPIWCLCSYLIEKFDKGVKKDVLQGIKQEVGRTKHPLNPSPFLPRLFVGDEASSAEYPVQDIVLHGKGILRPPHHPMNFEYPPMVPPSLEYDDTQLEDSQLGQISNSIPLDSVRSNGEKPRFNDQLPNDVINDKGPDFYSTQV